jgi:oxygen-independent coproporphyrinogen III oxidase
MSTRLEMSSLYLHIPFCRAKCAYCDFLSFRINEYADVSLYVRLLIKEMEIFRGESYSTVYIGGGTPSVLGREELSLLLGGLRRFFILDPLKEFTVEVNPESLDRTHLALFREYGVNRVSLGVQTFDDRALANVGRMAKRSDVIRAADLMRREGVRNFNVDLIQGIQEGGIFREDLAGALRLEPNHLSVYMLSAAPHTPLEGMIESAGFKVMGDEENEELYRHTCEFLSCYGFTRYEVSNYALPGCESAHNLCYWKGGDYRGVGLGAVSTIGSERRTNTGNFGEYRRMIERGEAPVSEIETLSPKTKIMEKIMLGLRTRWGIEKDLLFGLAGEGKRSQVADFIAVLDQNGYSIPCRDSLLLSGSGLFRSNTIIGELWSLLEADIGERSPPLGFDEGFGSC